MDGSEGRYTFTGRNDTHMEVCIYSLHKRPGSLTEGNRLLDSRERLNPRTQVSLIKIAMMIASGVVEEEKLAYYEKVSHPPAPLNAILYSVLTCHPDSSSIP